MVDPNDLLFDDRTLIKVSCDVVGRGTDKLDASVVGLVVRTCSFETRQE